MLKTNLHKHYETDKDLEKNGVWFKTADDVKFLLKRMGGSNSEGRQKAERLFRPYAKQIQKGTLSEGIVEKINRKILVDAVLLDWEGLKNEDGSEFEYNKENSELLFADLPDLVNDLLDHAGQSRNFLKDLEELDDLGNS